MPNQPLAEAGDDKSSAVAPAATTDSLINPGKEQKTFDERIDGASSPDEVRRLIAEASEGKAAPAKPAEEASPTATGAEATPNAEGGETTPTTEGATAEAGANNGEGGGEAAAPAAGAESGTPAGGEAAPKAGEGDDGGEGKLPERIRLTTFSKAEKLAMQLKRDDPTLSLAEAEKRAKAALGIKDETPAAANSGGPTLPASVADCDAKLEQLKQARTKARTEDLDFKEADRLDNEIDALKEHKLTLRETTAQATRDATAKYNADFDASETTAASLYDFASQKDSVAYKRMSEIDQQLEKSGDALFHDPSKPLKIAQMVARELNIAPKSSTAKPAAAPAGKPAAAAPVVVPKKVVPPVASGASRTVTPTTQGDQLAKEIDEARTPEDLEKILAKFKKR